MTREQLIAWRHKNGLSQSAAAEKFDMKVDTWRKYEYGINPIPHLLEKLLKILPPAAKHSPTKGRKK